MFLNKRFKHNATLIAAGLSLSQSALASFDNNTSIVVGPTFSSYTIDSNYTNKYGPTSMGVGYSLGAFFGFDFSSQWGADFGLLLVKRTTTLNFGSGNMSMTMLQMDLPFLLKYTPFSETPAFQLEAGPYFGVLADALFSQDGKIYDTSWGMNTIDFGAAGGVSLVLPFKDRIDLRFSALYFYGFNDMGYSLNARTRGLNAYFGIVIH